MVCLYSDPEKRRAAPFSLARFVTIYLPASRGSITGEADAMLKSRYHQLVRAFLPNNLSRDPCACKILHKCRVLVSIEIMGVSIFIAFFHQLTAAT